MVIASTVVAVERVARGLGVRHTVSDDLGVGAILDDQGDERALRRVTWRRL